MIKSNSIQSEKIATAIADELKLSINAATVLEKRYLRRDERGVGALRRAERRRDVHPIATDDDQGIDAKVFELVDADSTSGFLFKFSRTSTF